MDLNVFQERAVAWNTAYKPKSKRTPTYTITHLVEELGEVAADWRSGNLKRSFKLDQFGLQHPEGLGSEIADAILLLVVFADMNGLDVNDDVVTKLKYAENKLRAKKSKKSKGGK